MLCTAVLYMQIVDVVVDRQDCTLLCSPLLWCEATPDAALHLSKLLAAAAVAARQSQATSATEEHLSQRMAQAARLSQAAGEGGAMPGTSSPRQPMQPVVFNLGSHNPLPRDPRPRKYGPR